MVNFFRCCIGFYLWGGRDIFLSISSSIAESFFWNDSLGWLAQLVIDVLKALELSKVFVGFLFIGRYEFSNVTKPEIFSIWGVLKDLVIPFIMEADENVLVELFGELKHFLNEASSLVVENMVPLGVLFFFHVGSSIHGSSGWFLHFQVFDLF